MIKVSKDALDKAIKTCQAKHLSRRRILGLLGGAIKHSRANNDGGFPIRLLGVEMIARVSNSGEITDVEETVI